MADAEETIKQLNRSGFPFQLRIEHEIQSTNTQHNWETASREHPWQTPESSGFIDLVLSNKQFPADRLVIECKRVRGDDPRQLQWLFLLPDPNPRETKKLSCLEVMAGPPTRSTHIGWREHRVWEDLFVSPQSFQSEFCILSGDEPKRQPLLESLCAEALESIDGLVQEEVNIGRSQKSETRPLFLFPVIVTNAKIMVCQFHPSDVKITDGTLDMSKVKLDEIPFIRFRKSFSTAFPKEGKFFNLREANRARERSVFVVNAENLLEKFLKPWHVDSIKFAIQDLWEANR